MKFNQLVLKILTQNKNLAQIKDHNAGTNVRKMTLYNNPKLDLVNMNAYIKVGEKCQLVLKLLSGNEISE